MSESRNNKGDFKLGGALVVIGGFVYKVISPYVGEFVKTIAYKIADEIHNSKDGTITVPDLCRLDFPIDIDTVVSLLRQQGFKTATAELQLKDADKKYKDCIDNQAVEIIPRQGKKVKIGDLIRVRYITAEVINKSQKMFDDAEQELAKLKEEKMAKKLRRKERIKENVSEVIDMGRHKIGKRFTRENKQNIIEEKGDSLDE